MNKKSVLATSVVFLFVIMPQVGAQSAAESEVRAMMPTSSHWGFALLSKNSSCNIQGFGNTQAFSTTTLLFASKDHHPNIMRAVFMWPEKTKNSNSKDGWRHLHRVQGALQIDDQGNKVWSFCVEPLLSAIQSKTAGLAFFLEMQKKEGGPITYLSIDQKTFSSGHAWGHVDSKLGSFKIGLNGPRPDGTFAVGINH